MPQILSVESFFNKPSGKQLAQISVSEYILESFCQETPGSSAGKKVALTDCFLVVLEKIY